jgi:glutaminyl-peptide cyclotransferase
MHKKRSISLTILGLSLILVALGLAQVFWFPHLVKFNGKRALRDIEYQLSLGPRTPGSEAHAQEILWIKKEAEKAGWHLEIQALTIENHPIQNIIAFRSKEPPKVIIGAHYDSRMKASQDKGSAKEEPVPGANDGASGVAVLLELARTLPNDSVPVWLVFFDAEDNGNLPGWQWFLGSEAFVRSLQVKPDKVVIIDMIGDADLNIYYERNSDPLISDEIWNTAKELGYSRQFKPEPKHTISDDHIAFINAGIPAIDIIDFDYGPNNSYWHTTADTLDKVSAGSLQIVGDTLWHWIASLK